MQVIGIIATIAVFCAIGVLSGRRVKTKADFYVAGQSFGYLSVAGTASGMYVGGSAIIGAAQLAFTDGFSAIYFSLGCFTSLIFTGLFLSGPIRDSGHQTIQEMIKFEFGQTACLLATLLGIIAFYVNNISHFLSGISLIGSMFPLSTLVSSLITGALILICVYMGGFVGLSFINSLKTVILTTTVIISAVLIFAATSNFSEIAAALPERFLLYSPRGVNKDFGSFLSVVLGIMSTQSTIQTIFSAKSNRDCKRGLVLGAFVLPVVGFCCMIIGMYMRVTMPDINSLQVFPMFFIVHTHGFVSGIILATTLVAVASAGVSVMLGIASILINNIYLRARPDADTKSQLKFSRLIIVCLLTLTIIIINTGSSSAIMQYNFLSMGLRCAVLFLPMCAALFLPGKISPRFATASIVLGPCALLLGSYVLHLPFDSVFFALFVCAVVMGLGAVYQKYSKKRV